MRSALVLAALLTSSSASAQETTVRIFAAASLTDALSAVLDAFERVNPSSRVVPQFGGSSDLARQIIAGAPADVFFSADHRQMERVSVEERADVLSNELVIVRHRDDPDTVGLDAFERIAMAEPEVVPAGVYAREYLESQGSWTRLRSKIVPTLDVRGALAAVASGNVDAGFVYRTDAAIDPRVKIVYAVHRDEGPDIVYPLGLLDEQGRALYDYLRSDAAGEVFETFGFVSLAP